MIIRWSWYFLIWIIMTHLILSIVRWIKAEREFASSKSWAKTKDRGNEVICSMIEWWFTFSRRPLAPPMRLWTLWRQEPCLISVPLLTRRYLINLLKRLETKYRINEQKMWKDVEKVIYRNSLLMLQLSKESKQQKWSSENEEEGEGARSSEGREVVKCFLEEWENEWTILE